MAREKTSELEVVTKTQMPRSRLIIIITFSAIFLIVFLAIISILLYFYCTINTLNGGSYPIARDSVTYQQIKRIVDNINAKRFTWRVPMGVVLLLVELH